MRWLLGFLGASGLSLALMAGCSDENGEGGSGGTAGSGGSDLCGGVICEDTECKSDGVCNSADGRCNYSIIAQDGTACSEGECLDGVCAPVGAFSCTEQGIRDAIAEGEGPHFFACDGPTTVETQDTIEIDNDVILDGEDNLTVALMDGLDVISVAENTTATIAGFAVRGGGCGLMACYSGIFVDKATLTIANSRVSDNSGAGVRNVDGTVTLLNSTVSNSTPNVVNGGEGGVMTVISSTLFSGDAAGDTSAGGILNCGQLTMLNSTVSGNTGVGVLNACQGTTTLLSCTVSNNVHALRADDDVAVTLTDTIVDGDCSNVGATSTIVSDGYNIESPGDTCGFDQPTDQVNVSADDLKLGELADNGGPTMTHALGAGSVAIDVIPEAECVDAEGEPLTTDQRGEPRDSMCDVGAFEVQP